jgi:acyl-CoA reductase-like NAD-dependent aldehyde dehydrogenase
VRLNFYLSCHALSTNLRLTGFSFRPVVLELGGKGASIVLESADLENAAHSILFASSLHGGQICVRSNYVSRCFLLNLG